MNDLYKCVITPNLKTYKMESLTWTVRLRTHIIQSLDSNGIITDEITIREYLPDDNK